MKKQRTPAFTKRQRALLCEIAQEAHTLGRLYTTGGEKRLPGVEWERVRCMADESARARMLIGANEAMRRAQDRTPPAEPSTGGKP